MPYRWVAFYGDGSTFSSEDGGPWECPAGVVVIAQQRQDPANTAPLILGRCEWFAFHQGRWFDHCLLGLMGALMRDAGSIVAVRQGLYLADERDYQAIEAKARETKWAA